MMPSESEASRLHILALNIRATYERESAYVAQNWGSLLSTFMYTATYLLFVNIIYSNVRQVAGYGRDEMLFLILISQFSFYTIYTWSYNNLEQLIVDVSFGNLDLLLTKPIPSLFYICTRESSIIQVVRDGLPPITLVALSMHWANIHLTLPHVAVGILVFICGAIAFHTLQFLLTIPVFWLGEANAIFSLTWALSGEDIPLEGYPRILRMALTYVVPILFNVSVTTSVMLGKSDPVSALISAVCVAAVCLALRAWTWKKALRAYTSASS